MRSLTRAIAFVFALTMLVSTAHAQRGTILYDSKSKFQNITVLDTPAGLRQLIFDGMFDGTDSIQSEMKLASPTELTLAYSRHMITAVPLVKGKRVLVVGLGGACIQRYLHQLLPDTIIESAELDPDVLAVARRFFNFQTDDHQQVHIGDGRAFIEKSGDKYDLIMLDAFSATSIPYLLATKEFLTVCREHLAEGGMVCANLWYDLPEYPSMIRTYAEVFPEWYVLRCGFSSNNIVVAFPTKRDMTAEKWLEAARTFEKAHPTGLNLAQLIDRGLQPVTRISTDAKILLDKDAPKK